MILCHWSRWKIHNQNNHAYIKGERGHRTLIKIISLRKWFKSSSSTKSKLKFVIVWKRSGNGLRIWREQMKSKYWSKVIINICCASLILISTIGTNFQVFYHLHSIFDFNIHDCRIQINGWNDLWRSSLCSFAVEERYEFDDWLGILRSL